MKHMSRSDDIYGFLIVSSILHDLHGFRHGFLTPETSAVPSLHLPIACATAASRWLSPQHPDHTLTFFYGNSLEQNRGFLWVYDVYEDL